jgi:bis(5'-nucleosyl)-tetraphosphatase (symmetrical)
MGTGAAERQRARVFVGDVQGCREELERLLQALHYDPTGHALLFTGDLVNRGPDSAGVMRLAIQLGAQCVAGNHDVNLLRTARGQRPLRTGDTFGDVLRAEDSDELLAWLAELPLVLAHDDVLLVHAGISPAWADPVAALAGRDALAHDPDVAFALSARYCDERGSRPATDWPVPSAPFRPWHEFWPPRASEKRTVVFGHWARAGLVIKPQVRGLDSGCVWGGRLTAWIAEEDRLVHVDARRAWARD